MDENTAQELLRDVGVVRHRVRSDRRATSVPLVVFGIITLAEAVLRLVAHQAANDFVALLLAPIGFAVIAVYYRRREVATGVGSPTRPYAFTAVLLALAFVIFLGLALLFGTFLAVGLGLFVIAVRQRNLYLGVWAALYGVIGTLEGLSLISNRLFVAARWLGLFKPSDGYFSWSSSLVYGVIGAMLIGAGLFARKHEGAVW
jgi:hypothetical protein